MIITDALGFLGVPGGPIELAPELNLDLVHLTAAKPLPWGSDSMKGVKREILDFRHQISEFNNKLHLLEFKKNEDFDKIMFQVMSYGKTAVVLGLQHTPKDASARELRELDIKITQLSYSVSECDVLTGEERDFILDCDKYKICIDISHAGSKKAKSILDFAKTAEVKIPVIASHTACYGTYPHERNLSDEVLSQVAKQGGVVGIKAISFFLGHKDSNSITALQTHLHRAIHLCGVDSVCIGSDIPYLHRDEAEWEKHFSLMKNRLDPDGKLKAVWPDYPKTLNTANKERTLRDIISDLVYGNKIFSNILGMNFYRFVRDYL